MRKIFLMVLFLFTSYVKADVQSDSYLLNSGTIIDSRMNNGIDYKFSKITNGTNSAFVYATVVNNVYDSVNTSKLLIPAINSTLTGYTVNNGKTIRVNWTSIRVNNKNIKLDNTYTSFSADENVRPNQSVQVILGSDLRFKQ